jgi:lipoprotein-anchoring transpeptidase ErfK/SrfK
MPRPTRVVAASVVSIGALAICSPGPSAEAVETVRVSDERSSTYSATVARDVPVRAAPSRDARRVGSLRRWTFYGFREVVIVLRDTREGRPWTLLRYPGLGRRTGWVPSEALGGRRHTDRQIVINRGRTRLTVLSAGRAVFSTRVGVGAAASPTPAGRTYLRERLVPAQRGGLYGVLAFGLSSYSPFRTDWPGGGQVGIHGTNQPYLIPGRISNGCVRLRNQAIRRVDRLTGVGTPVLVR